MCWRRRTQPSPGPEQALRREPGATERRPAAGTHDPQDRDQRGGFRPLLPLPAALHRPLHRHHVGHPAPARCARHYGGSNRTIIKQAYEMLVSDRTAMANEADRHAGHARQGVRTGRGQPLQREAHRHPRHRPSGSRTIPKTRAGRCGSPRPSACWSSSVICPAPRPTSPPSSSMKWASPPRWRRCRRRSSSSTTPSSSARPRTAGSS